MNVPPSNWLPKGAREINVERIEEGPRELSDGTWDMKGFEPERIERWAWEDWWNRVLASVKEKR